METNSKKTSLEMKAQHSTKEAFDKKLGIVKRRIEAKEAYVAALEDHKNNLWKAVKETEGLYRSGYAVDYFEISEKINAQKSILSQHKQYLDELLKVSPNE